MVCTAPVEDHPCGCHLVHYPRRVVLTGGPGAGKTTTLGILRRYLCPHVSILPESASILFSGGFPRFEDEASKRAAQRAIFCVQHEVESMPPFSTDRAVTLCDRGTVDGLAYWLGDPAEFWAALHTTHAAELARYDVVIHLRTPRDGLYQRSAVRTETIEEARAIDARIEAAWAPHPRRHLIEAERDFLSKALHVLDIVRSVVPECCKTLDGVMT